MTTEDRRACSMTPLIQNEDVKPTICAHGSTVETCTVPECATLEISKIIDSLQNFERNEEGTSPLATDKPVFDFEGPQPTSPSQWEDFSFDMSVMPTSALPGQASSSGGHPGLGPLQQPQCSAGAMLLRDGGNMANQRASESPGLHNAVLRCRIQRNRHPSSSMSEGYSSDHTIPSPGPIKHGSKQVSFTFSTFIRLAQYSSSSVAIYFMVILHVKNVRYQQDTILS